MRLVGQQPFKPLDDLGLVELLRFFFHCFDGLAIPLILAIGTIVVGTIAWNSHAQQDKTQGDEPYLPTKLEWLALVLDTKNQNDAEGPRTWFNPHPKKKNTIEATIIHSPKADDQFVRLHTALAKSMVRRYSKEYGWDWAQVEVNVGVISELEAEPKNDSQRRP